MIIEASIIGSRRYRSESNGINPSTKLFLNSAMSPVYWFFSEKSLANITPSKAFKWRFYFTETIKKRRTYTRREAR